MKRHAVTLRNMILTSLMFFLFSGAVMAQSTDTTPLVIGTKTAPPFVIKQASGDFEGLSIELWRRIADDAGLTFTLQEESLDALIADVSAQSLDGAVAAITVSADRETRLDFSHPYFTTGLAIAVPSEKDRLGAAIAGLFSWEFFAALSGLCLLLFAVGSVLWLFERKRNAEMFGGSTASGLGASFWWAAVTMTTVGYGDKAPVTLGGRVVGFIWMFAAIILISSFTAAIATSLTVSQLETQVRGLGDLPDVRVATVSESSSARFLEREGIGFQNIGSVNEGLSLLQQGKIDALVYDKPILQYYIQQDYRHQLQILPDIIERQDYAIALPEGSALREQINMSLLRVIESDDWARVMDSYLGK
ncbi:transporter substrate-binding domain-containing protein [Alteromonas sp. CYL-A6]|uniref:transporter substrate-binding domain-containing protein n=1 Tax=Alteromonas nitratireducens TaxID=3390813 RepID=UPI0034B62B2D